MTRFNRMGQSPYTEFRTFPEKLVLFEKLVNETKMLRNNLNHLIDALMKYDNGATENLSSLAQQTISLRTQAFSFLEKNKDTIDTTVRLSMSAGFIGLFSIAGASMTVVTPAVLALFGGKKFIAILKQFQGKS